MGTLTLRLPDKIDQQLTKLAEEKSKTRSEIVWAALEKFLSEAEQAHLMAQLVEEARAAYANKDIRREAMKIAEEFLPLENEALDLAEGRKPGKPSPRKLTEKWWK